MKKKFIETYRPLISQFIDKIRTVNYNNIPEPFLPAFGSGYEFANVKIVFVGMETRGYGNISDFVKQVDENIDDSLFRVFEEFDSLDFCGWGNNFGISFWDFSFKFLANFYNLPDWKELKGGENETILKSFAWGNINSIERYNTTYNTTAEKKGVALEDWSKVKDASRIIDGAKNIISALQPDLMIILNWSESQEWLTDGFDRYTGPEDIEDHCRYFYLDDTKTHVIWTAHPTWLSKNKDFDAYIERTVDMIKKKINARAQSSGLPHQ